MAERASSPQLSCSRAGRSIGVPCSPTLCAEPIAAPLPLDAVRAHEDALGAEFFLGVAVQVETGKTARLNITMPEDLVKEVDAYAERRGMNRSAFLAMAARQAMRKGA